MSSRFVAKNAAGYETFMGRWSRRLAEPFLDFADISGCRHVLDIGCGTGSLTNAVAARHPDAERIVGVDFSPVYLAFAQEKSSDPRIAYQTGDACELDLEENSFDASVSLLVLNFIPSYERAAADMLRVTKQGGRVAAAVWDSFGGLVVLRMFWDTAAMLDPNASTVRGQGMAAPLAQEGRLADTFRELGALDVEEADILTRMRFYEFEDYWTPFLAGDGPPGAYVVGLDDDQRERFRSALYDAYCAGQADGPRSFVGVVRAIRCRAP